MEAQALNRMRLWSEHFERVTICAPLLPSGDPDPSTIVWADATELLEAGRVYFEPFPWGYHPREHCRHRREVRARLDVLVAQHRYLCFSNLGVFGTWGNFAVDAARRQNRCYSLWFDWVLHEMAAAHGGSAKARLKDLLYGMWTKRITNARCAVAAWVCSMARRFTTPTLRFVDIPPWFTTFMSIPATRFRIRICMPD